MSNSKDFKRKRSDSSSSLRSSPKIRLIVSKQKSDNQQLSSSSSTNYSSSFNKTLTDDDSEFMTPSLSRNKRAKPTHSSSSLSNELLATPSTSFGFNSDLPSDVFFGLDDVITLPDLDSKYSKDSHDFSGFSDAVSSSVSSPRDFDEIFNEPVLPFQPFESLDSFNPLDPLGPSPLDAVIQLPDDTFDTHFPDMLPFESDKLHSEPFTDSYDQQIKFVANDIQSLLPEQSTPSVKPVAASAVEDKKQKKQQKKPKLSGINVATPGVQHLSAALSSTIPSLPISALDEISQPAVVPSPIDIQISDIVQEDEAVLSVIPPLDHSADNISSVLDLDVTENLDLLPTTVSSADLGDKLTSVTSTGLIASNAPSDLNKGDAIFTRWSQGLRERSNSFATLVNRSSFKQLARALSSNSAFLDSLTESAVCEKHIVGETGKDEEDSADDFLNLIDETMLQTTSEDTDSEKKDASHTPTPKIPLCGYRYRNQTIKIPNGTLNPKKILAALASISTENEKLVASFPSSSSSSSLSGSSIQANSPAKKYESGSSESLVRLSESSYNSAGALSTCGTNTSSPFVSGLDNNNNNNNTHSTASTSANVASNTESSSKHTIARSSSAFELTRSALEYYQQAVVAAAGLNRHSLYSGKGREMIAGSNTW